MKWLKGIFILALVLAVIGFGGLTLYEEAYSILEPVSVGGVTIKQAAGYSVGYDNGYSVGQKDGYSLGKTEGYSLGEEDGHEEGYNLGKQDGREEGYGLGKQDGREEGYISGEADGYEQGVAAGLGHGYTLKDPTYKQVITFLREDKTDKNKYVEDTYICSHFARDVCNNAEAQEFRCAYIEIRHPDRGHSIIAFDTIDRGLLYFEPQSDETVKLIIGKEFWRCIEPKPGYYYEKPPHDDTIMDILVIW